ncbi:uncharacterized protein TNCV_3051441 [Trichonephila clavipes]|nr:uncharacterized protein TNCV_3051441 [Trichonephila clavipes]
MREVLNTISLSICRTLCESGHLLAHSISNVLSCCKPPTTYWFLNVGNEIKVTKLISPLKNGYFDVIALFNTGYLYLISHDTHQLTDFPALAALLSIITDPSVVLHTHYAYRTFTQPICDPFTYLQEKKELP